MALQPEPPLLTASARRRSWPIKIGAIGVLLVLLHVPLMLTRGVLRERQQYQAQAVSEMTSVWGHDQRVTGPVLAVPYTYKGKTTRTKLVNGQWTEIEEPAMMAATAYFLPDALQVDASLDPEVRHRGIYDAVVYTTRLKLKGTLRADFATAGIEAEQIEWEKARVLFGVSDLHGLRSMTPWKRPDGGESTFEAGENGATPLWPLVAKPGLSSAVATAPIEFTLEVVVQGSGSLNVAPVGKNSTVKLVSSWASPSFIGAGLPVTRNLSDAGFEAVWTVAHFSRGFPQAWTSRLSPEGEVAKKIDAAMFGVRLARGVDGYGVVERAQKYGLLFFVLVFAVYAVFELTGGLQIHPLQYAMVGAALCLFFLAFLALTEFWTTASAYATSAGACTAMIALYSWSFLQTGWRTWVVAGGLGATYGYLYFVLKSEDYALISGTAALFAMLALVMFLTRRINWYTLDAAPAGGMESPRI